VSVIARMFELHPNHQRAYVTLARNLSAHGRYAESVLALEEALEHYPDSEVFNSWHAWDMVTIGLFDEAEAEGIDAVNF
jgi:hypothetical protein